MRQIHDSLHSNWWRQDLGSGAFPRPETVQNGQASGNLLPFRALLAFTFILLLSPQNVYTVLAPLRIAMLSALLAVIAHIYDRLSRGLPLIELSRPVILALAIAAWAVMTVPLSFWPGGSVEFLLGDYFKTLVVFVLLAHVIDTAEKMKQICLALVLIAMVLALTTLRNYLSGASIETGGRVLGYNAPLTANPNDMALMLNLILPVGVALLLSCQRLLWRLVLVVTLCILVAAIIVTFSRAGFLTLCVTFTAYFWQLRKRREWIWIPVFLLVVLGSIPLMPDTYTARLSTITDIESDSTGSAQTRLSDMIAAGGFVLRHPLTGAGVGMNALAMNEARGETWTEIHNVYLQYAVELGVAGLLLFLLLFRECLKSTRVVPVRQAANDSIETLRYIAEGLKISLIAFAVAAFFHPVAYHFYFYYIAGLAVAIKSIMVLQERQ